MMQNHTGHVSIDPEFQTLRITMQERICKWLEKKQPNSTSEWKQWLPEIAKKVEESIFKESVNKEDYMSKFQNGVEMRIASELNQMKQNQLPIASMQNHTGHVTIDPEFQALRINMQERICKWLEKRRPNSMSEWKQRLPELAKKVEESTFKESINKEDYMSKFQGGVEMRIASMLNQMKQNQLRLQQLHHQQQQLQQMMAHHNIQSNSSASGISHNPTGTIRISSAMESNQGINPASASAGTMSNGYQLPQMIPTPGFNTTNTTQVTQQTMPMNSDYNDSLFLLQNLNLQLEE